MVANEVKELAKQAALATQEISQRIEAIRTDSQETVGDRRKWRKTLAVWCKQRKALHTGLTIHRRRLCIWRKVWPNRKDWAAVQAKTKRRNNIAGWAEPEEK